MIIRLAQAGDEVGIANVHVQSWRETYPGIMPDAVLQNLSVERRQAWWQRVLTERLAESPTFVALIDDEIVAFVSGGEVRGDFDRYDAELYAIYALKSAQGQGIGRALMEHLAQKLHDMGYTSMMLWVAKGNPTEKFYAHMGGQHFTEKTEVVAETQIIELAYGWPVLRTLLTNEKD